MRLEIYAPRASPVHALHPSTKLALLVLAIVGPFFADSPSSQLVALAGALAWAALGRVGREVLSPWKLLLFIFATTFLLWGAMSASGWGAAARYGLRVTAVFMFGLAFLATTRIEETIHALGAAGVPYRLAFSLGLAFRLVPLFLQSAGAILDAQRARGLDLARGGVLARLRKYVPVLIPVFMTSLRNADAMAMALDARGFGAPGPRTQLRRYDAGRADGIAMFAAIGYFAFFLWAGGGRLSSIP